MDSAIIQRVYTAFEGIKHETTEGQEFWLARELQPLLGYTKRENFLEVIGKAKESCKRSSYKVSDHFPEVGKMIDLGKGGTREIQDMMLTRYACYLIAQNGDSRKQEIALAQTYFATQARKQEIQQQYQEDQKRIDIRKELTQHNKSLASTAKKSGVQKYAQFQDAGYQGLYGGLRARDIKKQKGLSDKENMLDYMSSEELGANLFRATQTDAKLQRELASGKRLGQQEADKTHFEVGKKVRKTIQELGGTMPEQLPLAEHIKQSQKRLQDMAYDGEVSLGNTAEAIPQYKLPDDAQQLQRLLELLKHYPGTELVMLGSQYFQVSEAGREKIATFFAEVGSYSKDY